MGRPVTSYGYPIPTSLPVTPRLLPPRETRPEWPGFKYREAACHDRPTRPQTAGHERERDDS